MHLLRDDMHDESNVMRRYLRLRKCYLKYHTLMKYLSKLVLCVRVAESKKGCIETLEYGLWLSGVIGFPIGMYFKTIHDGPSVP